MSSASNVKGCEEIHLREPAFPSRGCGRSLGRHLRTAFISTAVPGQVIYDPSRSVGRQEAHACESSESTGGKSSTPFAGLMTRSPPPPTLASAQARLPA